MKEVEADAVYWNRRYCPSEQKKEAELASFLRGRGISCYDFRSDLLVEPEDLELSHSDFRSFHRAWRRRLRTSPPPKPLPSLTDPIRCFASHSVQSTPLDELQFLDDDQEEEERFSRVWGGRVGCDSAKEILSNFLNDHREPYRNLETHRLAPHLRFGEISPRVLYYSLLEADIHNGIVLESICMREYAFHLRMSPRTEDASMWEEKYPSRTKNDLLCRWQHGQTGFPIIDGAMRQLRSEGWLHVRLHIAVAGFFIKYLLLPWQLGARIVQSMLLEGEPSVVQLRWKWLAENLCAQKNADLDINPEQLWRSCTKSKVKSGISQFSPSMIWLLTGPFSLPPTLS